MRGPGDTMKNQNTNNGGQTIEANRLPKKTKRSLGYHLEEDNGVCVSRRDTEETNPTSISDMCVVVAATAFVLAGVALSTIPMLTL